MVITSNMMLTDIEDKILQVVTKLNRPVTIQEVAYELGISVKIATQAFRNLVSNGDVIVFSPANSTNKYYAPLNSNETTDQMLAQKYVDLIEPLEKKFEQVKQEQEKLSSQLHGVYAQIITLMGIFVAIFALIIINVNAIGEFASTIADPWELCKALAILNIPLVISLVILTLLIRLVIKPPKRKNRIQGS